jgi:hypothetical protein
VPEGVEGVRFADSTEDPGPMKPGNSVEDKTLATWRQEGPNEAGKGPDACGG